MHQSFHLYLGLLSLIFGPSSTPVTQFFSSHSCLLSRWADILLASSFLFSIGPLQTWSSSSSILRRSRWPSYWQIYLHIVQLYFMSLSLVVDLLYLCCFNLLSLSGAQHFWVGFFSFYSPGQFEFYFLVTNTIVAGWIDIVRLFQFTSFILPLRGRTTLRSSYFTPSVLLGGSFFSYFFFHRLMSSYFYYLSPITFSPTTLRSSSLSL